MGNQISVGVIGLGFMGRAHVANYERLPNAKVVAVADADPDRRQGRANVVGNIEVPLPQLEVSEYQVFADGKDLIEQADVDLVDICLPTYLHAEFAERAASAGRHVVVEKPMALSASQATRMIEAAQRNGVELMVAQCLRFWPEYVYLKDVVETERLGKLIKAEFVRRSARPIWTWQNWMIDAERSGGAMLDLHVHDVDYVNFVFGKPDRLYARAIRSDATGGYDLVTALYSYADGPEIVLDAAWYKPESFAFRAMFLAVFEKGMVHFDGSRTPSLLVHKEGSEPEGVALEGDAYYNELEFFVNCLIEGHSPAEVVPPESACQSIQLIEAEKRSSESGQILTL